MLFVDCTEDLERKSLLSYRGLVTAMSRGTCFGVGLHGQCLARRLTLNVHGPGYRHLVKSGRDRSSRRQAGPLDTVKRRDRPWSRNLGPMRVGKGRAVDQGLGVGLPFALGEDSEEVVLSTDRAGVLRRRSLLPLGPVYRPSCPNEKLDGGPSQVTFLYGCL